MRARALAFPFAVLLSVPLALGACGERKPATTAKPAASAKATDEGTAETKPTTDTVTAEAPPPPPAPGTSSKLLGDARAAYDQGVTKYNAGDLAGAAQSFQQAIGAEPKAYEAHYALGVTYERMGKTGDALESYRNAYKLNPNFDAAIAAYGFLLYRNGSHTEAEKFLEDQSAKNPKALGVMTALAEIKSLNGDSNAAQTLAGNVLVIEAKYEPAMVLIARDHYRRGRDDLATYVLSAILDGQRTQEEKEKDLPAKASPPRAPNNAEAHLLRAIILAKTDRRAAARWFESAAKIRPDLFDAQLQLGLIRLEANDAEGALEPLRRAVMYNASSVDAHLALGDAYRLYGGKAPEAKKEYLWVVTAAGAPAKLKALAQYNLGLLYFLTPGIDGMSDVQRYDKSVEYWNQYKVAKGTATADWPTDADDLIEQARRARNAAAAAGGGAGGTTPKPAAS
ncbi:MAG: tetratricopeptide repeat protein, partial [Deltaproteobacteria bacterium]|nr:tetratricopeptide repeat protein [Deltaproteobacteria bacterium]